MSITLLCLVKGNTTANAFKVDIEKDKSVSKLKEVIKAKKQNELRWCGCRQAQTLESRSS